MACIVITLSEDELIIARHRAADQRVDIEPYIHDLVAERVRLDQGDDHGAPEDLPITSKEQLNQLIREGLVSPARVMTKEDFATMRRDLIQRKMNPGVTHDS